VKQQSLASCPLINTGAFTSAGSKIQRVPAKGACRKKFFQSIKRPFSSWSRVFLKLSPAMTLVSNVVFINGEQITWNFVCMITQNALEKNSLGMFSQAFLKVEEGLKKVTFSGKL